MPGVNIVSDRTHFHLKSASGKCDLKIYPAFFKPTWPGRLLRSSKFPQGRVAIEMERKNYRAQGRINFSPPRRRFHLFRGVSSGRQKEFLENAKVSLFVSLRE
jgi:hypothetical protein